jgi:hypothetical protein
VPWSVKSRGGKYCVIKDADGSTVKCHPSRKKALAHQRALYANVHASAEPENLGSVDQLNSALITGFEAAARLESSLRFEYERVIREQARAEATAYKLENRQLTAALFDESKHPRHPRGSELGGEFAPNSLPPAPPPGHVRLYRGIDPERQAENKRRIEAGEPGYQLLDSYGNFFTTDWEIARRYAADDLSVVAVDVPEEQALEWISMKTIGGDTMGRFARGVGTEFILPPEVTAKARRVVRDHRDALTSAATPRDEELKRKATQRTAAVRAALVAAAAEPIFEALAETYSPAAFEALLNSQAGTQAERLVKGVRESVELTILESLAEGRSVPQTAAAIRERVELDAAWQATMLARTDLIALSNGASLATAESVSAGPQYKMWLATEDERTRVWHGEADRQIVGIHEAFQVGGEPLQYPGDPHASDGNVINCRCTLVYADSPAEMPQVHSSLQDLALAAALFEESKHPRHPRGTERGGEFAPARVAAVAEELARSWTFDGEPGLKDEFLVPSLRQLENDFSRWDLSSYEERLAAVNEPWYRRLATFEQAWNATGVQGPENVLLRGLTSDPGWEAGQILDIPLSDWTTSEETAAGYGGTLLELRSERAFPAQVLEGGDPTPMSRWITGGRFEVLSKEGRYVLVRRESLRAAAEEGKVEDMELSEILDRREAALTAAGGVGAPSTWFTNPGLDGPTPLTVTADGRVVGHAAVWGTCHTGIQGRCQEPPHSRSNYQFFHLKARDTADGQTVPVGTITLDTGHAPLTASRAATAAHYDNTGTRVADVVVGEDAFGIWVSGALAPDVPEEKIQALKAAALSGDWRSVNGQMELIGLLAVNVPGFPVPRAQMALAASAEGEDVPLSLVAAGVYCGCEDDELELLAQEVEKIYVDSRMPALLAAVEMEQAERDRRLQQLALTAAYNPNQPRSPKGSDTGGQWVKITYNSGEVEYREGLASKVVKDLREEGLKVGSPEGGNDAKVAPISKPPEEHRRIEGGDLKVGDKALVRRYGKEYLGEVVSVGRENVKVRFVYGNGVERTVTERKKWVKGVQ